MRGTWLALDDAVATAATGDIWLFRGRSLADRAIQTVTNSPVNHVGMVVALDDLPPLLWHAELGRSLPDVWTGQRQRGVQLHLLRDAVQTWDERYGQRAWLRQLEGTVERHHEDKLMEVIARYDGRPTTRRRSTPDGCSPGLKRGDKTFRMRWSCTFKFLPITNGRRRHRQRLPAATTPYWKTFAIRRSRLNCCNRRRLSNLRRMRPRFRRHLKN